jgi:hypothetical protein
MRNPQEYREFARQCIEMANSFERIALQPLLFDMAEAWLKVAERVVRQLVKDSDGRSTDQQVSTDPTPPTPPRRPQGFP